MGLKEGEMVNQQYEVVQKLGEGRYGQVYLVCDNHSGDLYALKSTHKKHIKKNRELEANLHREIQIHSKLRHPNIVTFHRSFKDQSYVYFLLDFISPGEIRDQLYLDSEDSEYDDDVGFTEPRAQYYIRQIISALIYLRDRSVIHRDLKPENILLDEDDNIKLADFGWACTKCSKSSVGTYYYNAPEMVQLKLYNYKSDIWSMGIVLYEFLYKCCPFEASGKTHDERERRSEKLICHSTLKFPDSPRISGDCKRLIAWILTKDPNMRPDYEQILKHRWFKVIDQNDYIKNRRTRSRSSISLRDELYSN